MRYFGNMHPYPLWRLFPTLLVEANFCNAIKVTRKFLTVCFLSAGSQYYRPSGDVEVEIGRN